MLDEIQELYSTLSQNQIAVSIILTPLITGLSYLLAKSLPKFISRTAIGLIATRVDIYSSRDHTSFEAGEYLLSQLKVKSLFNRFCLRSTEFTKKPVFTIGEDTTVFSFVNSVPVFISRSNDASASYDHHFVLSFTFLTRNRNKIIDIFQKAKIDMDSRLSEDEMQIYVANRWGSTWDNFVRDRRNLIPRTQSQKEVFDRVVSCLKDRKLNKLGILLYGQPGCGKSALIEQIVYYLGYKLYYFSAASLKEETFLSLIGEMTSPSVILFEDIDCCKATGSRDKNNEREPVSLSTILNVFDGLLSLNRQIIIATTNHYDQLDPALRRKGRFDISVELLPMKQEEIEEFVTDYFQEDFATVKEYTSKRFETLELPIADVTSICQESDSCQEALEAMYYGKKP